MKLFVRNLPYTCTDEQLREIFEEAGTVVSAKVVTDRYTGKSRGFGFVEMSSAAEGKDAIEKINGKSIDGRTLEVDKAKESAPRENGGGSGGGGRPPQRDRGFRRTRP